MPRSLITRRAGPRPGSAYKRIEADILRKIRRGVWPVGAKIHSRQQLARDYGVDLSTVQKAISTLLSDGVVASDGTRGTYVSRLPLESDNAVPDEDLNDVTVRGRIVTNISWETPRMPGLDVAPPVAKKVIGIAGRFAPDISELLVPYILAQAIEHALAASKDIALRFYDTFCDRKHSVSICEGVEKLLHEAIDALCVIYPEPEDVEAILTSAQCTRTPVLFISPEVLSEPVAQVYIDHRYDGYQAAKYFLDMGHKEILYIHLAEHHWSYERLKGIQAAARFAGLPESAVRVHPESGADQLPGHPESFLKPLQAWARTELSRGTLRGALIAANDQVALSILDVAEAIGVTTNSGFSLLGFDDVPQARRRGLTTLRPPLYDMGREAARLLETLLNQGEIRGESIHSRMISQIVVRSSAA